LYKYAKKILTREKTKRVEKVKIVRKKYREKVGKFVERGVKVEK
jgi:hypothetical protein